MLWEDVKTERRRVARQHNSAHCKEQPKGWHFPACLPAAWPAQWLQLPAHRLLSVSRQIAC